jgi:hypothetical protein
LEKAGMNKMPIREDILKEIIREEERLAEQKAEIEKTEARIHVFRMDWEAPMLMRMFERC